MRNPFTEYQSEDHDFTVYRCGILGVGISKRIRSLDIFLGRSWKNHAQTRILVEKKFYLSNKAVNAEKPTICAFLTLALFHARVKIYYKPD